MDTRDASTPVQSVDRGLGLGAKEFDDEAGRALGFDVMLDIGRDALREIGLNDHVGDRIGASNETQRSIFDAQTTPRPARYSMRATERVGHRALIPCCGSPYHDQAVGEFATVAQRAVQRRADASISLGLVLDPGCRPERRTMTHVLAVVALEQRYPVAGVVSSEADDLAQHAVSVRAWPAMP